MLLVACSLFPWIDAAKPVSASAPAPSALSKGSRYAPDEIDFLLQDLRPMKGMKKGRINIGRLKAGRLSSSKVGHKSDLNLLWFRRGLEYTVKKEYDNAIAAFTAAVAADPRDAGSYYNRAVLHQKCGGCGAAMDDYTRAARLAPSDADIYYNRALAQQCSGNINAAIEDYTRAIRLNPDDPEPYWNRGVAYSHKGRDDLASTDYCRSKDLIGVEHRPLMTKEDFDAIFPPISKASNLPKKDPAVEAPPVNPDVKNDKDGRPKAAASAPDGKNDKSAAPQSAPAVPGTQKGTVATPKGTPASLPALLRAPAAKAAATPAQPTKAPPAQ